MKALFRIVAYPFVLVLFVTCCQVSRSTAEEPVAESPPAPFTQAKFKEHVVFLSSDELRGREVGTEGWRTAAEYVIEHLEAAGVRPLKDDGDWFQTFPINDARRARNILGVLPGKGTLKEEAVIVTAHPDHIGEKRNAKENEDAIFNGADDNASGMAALLLIAEAIEKQRKALPDNHRTVIFACFDAEEWGLRGAIYYVGHPLWPLEKTAAVINFDSVGRLRMGKLFASDAETSPLLARVVVDAAKSRGLVAETRFGGHGRSDHAVFIERGIPGMHFFTGANSDYHQVSDEWEKLNLEGGARIAWIGWRAVQAAITHPEPIAFEKPSPVYNMQFAINFVRRMGIVPVLNAQEGRYPQILYVMPNTPAAKNGLKAGDQITAVNGIKFQRVEDALTIFPQLTFENGLRLSILRSGEEVDVKIPASVFESMSGPTSKRLDNGLYEVTVRYQAGKNVKSVYLAGEFNDWKPTELKLEGPDEQGWFTKTLELKAGTYEYKFVHEGTEWKADPQNLYQVGRYGNSVMWVGTQPQ